MSDASEDPPAWLLAGVRRVVAFGNAKHGGTWDQARPGAGRHLGGALRHLSHCVESCGALDKESGELHLDHAITRLLMIRHHLKGIIP